ncbi:MAG: HAMP domain-containing protein [Dehalococcoidales bacterium]|nr:HAMP domain-containing protein [Dehalococcoidales bacterium]
MRNFIRWSRWSIALKIVVTFLLLSIISMGIMGYFALVTIRDLGDYAIQTSSYLGESAITDSTAHLNSLGESMINQKANDVALQVSMYFSSKPPLTIEEMRNDPILRAIVVQPVGISGYTTLIDPQSSTIIIHKYREQEKELSSLKESLPTFWELMKSSTNGRSTDGYYDWLEVDGSITNKFASIVPVNNKKGSELTLWATTYIEEFSLPAEETKKGIMAAIQVSSEYITNSVKQMQNTFIITFIILVFVVIGLSLFLSWILTSPITALKRGAEALGSGELDHKIEVYSEDELGQLAKSFNKMATDIKKYTEEIKLSAAENIEKERKIQDNLRSYVKQVSQAQEAERKRIARELHDETAQALVVVLRHLDDLSSGRSSLSADEIREEVRKILEGVRHYSQELRPSILDNLGLIPALKWLASDLTKNYGIAVETQIEGRQRMLPAEIEMTLFRITQEALTNIRKHARAGETLVRIEFAENRVKITIRDNGQGFEIPTRIGDLSALGKLGMIGMQERANLLRGTFSIESKPGEGTTITVEIPLQ